MESKNEEGLQQRTIDGHAEKKLPLRAMTITSNRQQTSNKSPGQTLREEHQIGMLQLSAIIDNNNNNMSPKVKL